MGVEVKIQVGEGHPVPAAELALADGVASLLSAPETVKDATNLVGAARPAAAAAPGIGKASSAPHQMEKGSSGNEQCRAAKGQKDIEFGAVVAVFSFAVMLAGFFLSPATAKGPQKGNWRLDILMLLAFASFITGFSFMLLSMQLLGAREIHVSCCHRVLSRCLFCACSVLPALTLLSLLVVMPFKPYVYAGLAVLATVALPVAIVHCYVSHRAAAAEVPEPDAAAAEQQEQQDQMDASFKITAAMAASSFAGLVGMLFGVYKHSGGGGAGVGATATPGGVHVAIMFMFSTAVVSMLLMMLSMKALEISKKDLRRSVVRVIRHANSVLLCSLAVATLSAAFVILQCYILAAFVSLAVAGIVHFIIQNCTPAAGEADRVDQGSNANPNSNQETQLKWMADIASKVTAYSLGGVMAIFGGFLGEADSSHDKMVAIKICMFLLTSAFASGLGLMLLTTRCCGSTDRVGFKAATSILAWSAMGLLAAAALAIYGVEVLKS